MIYEAELTFSSLPFFTRVDASTHEILECLKTGLYKNQPVKSIRLFAISDNEHSHVFVYDIEAAKSGQQPWSIRP